MYRLPDPLAPSAFRLIRLVLFLIVVSLGLVFAFRHGAAGLRKLTAPVSGHKDNGVTERASVLRARGSSEAKVETVRGDGPRGWEGSASADLFDRYFADPFPFLGGAASPLTTMLALNPPAPSTHSLDLTGGARWVKVSAPSESSLNVAQPFTLEAWIKTSAAAQQGIVERWKTTNTLGDDGGYALRLTGTGKVNFFSFRKAGFSNFVQSAAVVNDNKWHHLAGVVSNGQMKLFVDGCLAKGASGTTTNSALGTSDLLIGSSPLTATVFNFDGLIDEVRLTDGVVYENDFTPELSLTNSNKPGTSTKGLWKFEDTSLADDSGNLNTGIAKGGAPAQLSTTVPTTADLCQPCTQTPFLGMPFAIPGTIIQAEDFDKGGEGAAYHDLSATNDLGEYRNGPCDRVDIFFGVAGNAIGNAQAGEWLEYTVNVSASGTYDIKTRVASSGLGGRFHIEVDGVDKTGALDVPDTGGWGLSTDPPTAWQEVTKTGVSLSAGQHVLRLSFDVNSSDLHLGGYTALGNFDSISIVVPPPPNQPPTVAIAAPTPPIPTYTAPATITMTVTATDSDGIQGVNFSGSGGLAFGPSQTPPPNYSFTWSNVAAGTYTLTATAIDNQGASASASVSVQVTNPPPAQQEGSHELASCTRIAGWAWNSSLPNTPINVDIYDGGNKIATVPADQFRQDLLNNNKGNGFHGFSVATPASLKNGQPHSLTVKFVTATNLPGTPRSITCAATTGDTIGAYDPATSIFYLHTANTSAPAEIFFQFGPAGAGWTPITGDWNGDGIDTVGLYRPSDRTFFLHNANDGGNAEIMFLFGGVNWKPLAGDWNGDGTDTVGVYRPSDGTFFLHNANDSNPAEIMFTFRDPNLIPFSGDWDGDGRDEVGVYNPSTATFYLRHSTRPGDTETLTLRYGGPNWRPDMGDWNNDGKKTLGVFQPAGAFFHLRNSNTEGPGELSISFGDGAWTPLSGRWGPTATTLYQGSHDSADCNFITGWARDTHLPTSAINVDIFDGNTLLATVAANQTRPDLDLVGLGGHAFAFATPASVKNGVAHSITVKFGGTNTLLGNTPRSITCGTPAGPTLSKEYIYVDGRLIATEEPSPSPTPTPMAAVRKSPTKQSSSDFKPLFAGSVSTTGVVGLLLGFAVVVVGIRRYRLSRRSPRSRKRKKITKR